MAGTTGVVCSNPVFQSDAYYVNLCGSERQPHATCYPKTPQTAIVFPAYCCFYRRSVAICRAAQHERALLRRARATAALMPGPLTLDSRPVTSSQGLQSCKMRSLFKCCTRSDPALEYSDNQWVCLPTIHRFFRTLASRWNAVAKLTSLKFSNPRSSMIRRTSSALMLDVIITLVSRS